MQSFHFDFNCSVFDDVKPAHAGQKNGPLTPTALGLLLSSYHTGSYGCLWHCSCTAFRKSLSPPPWGQIKFRIGFGLWEDNESCIAFISAVACFACADLQTWPFLSNQQRFYFPCCYSNKTSLHIALFLITPLSLGDNGQTESGILQTGASLSLLLPSFLPPFLSFLPQLLRGLNGHFSLSARVDLPKWWKRETQTFTSRRLTVHKSDPRLGTHHCPAIKQDWQHLVLL